MCGGWPNPIMRYWKFVSLILLRMNDWIAVHSSVEENAVVSKCCPPSCPPETPPVMCYTVNINGVTEGVDVISMKRRRRRMWMWMWMKITSEQKSWKQLVRALLRESKWTTTQFRNGIVSTILELIHIIWHMIEQESSRTVRCIHTIYIPLIVSQNYNKKYMILLKTRTHSIQLFLTVTFSIVLSLDCFWCCCLYFFVGPFFHS